MIKNVISAIFYPGGYIACMIHVIHIVEFLLCKAIGYRHLALSCSMSESFGCLADGEDAIFLLLFYFYSRVEQRWKYLC